MFKVTQLITLKPEISVQVREAACSEISSAARRSEDVSLSLLQPTLAGVFNGGDLILHLQSDSANAALAMRDTKKISGVQSVESVTYEGGNAGRSGEGLTRGVYRVLLLSIKEGAPTERVAQFEKELFQMPEYISAIRAWQLSRVSEASGSRKWTHVWEQEFSDIDGLMGPYMAHPYHWGYIDRWFDPEHQDHIVDTHLCHTFCDFDQPIIKS